MELRAKAGQIFGGCRKVRKSAVKRPHQRNVRGWLDKLPLSLGGRIEKLVGAEMSGLLYKYADANAFYRRNEPEPRSTDQERVSAQISLSLHSLIFIMH